MYNKALKIILSCLVALLIVNGAEAVTSAQLVKNSQAPYVVQLRTKWGQSFCGGTLIAPQYVVTSASCLKTMTIEEVLVYGGISDDPATEEKRGIVSWYIPFEYNDMSLNMDIAVIKLFRELKGKNIKPIGLCSEPLKEPESAQVLTWAKPKENEDYSKTLIAIMAPIISAETCQAKQSLVQLTETMVCGNVPDSRDSCIGSSGGAVVRKGKLCGVVSLGAGCSGSPDIFTSIAAARQFIDHSMKQ